MERFDRLKAPSLPSLAFGTAALADYQILAVVAVKIGDLTVS
jgi:hypothetical protein